MRWLKWLPWKFIIRRVARAYGFLDPIALFAYVHRFSQPSEVHEPIELLRAGVVLDAWGFSAEHLGPNGYYYWADFWGISGLHATASLAESMGHNI